MLEIKGETAGRRKGSRAPEPARGGFKEQGRGEPHPESSIGAPEGSGAFALADV